MNSRIQGEGQGQWLVAKFGLTKTCTHVLICSPQKVITVILTYWCRNEARQSQNSFAECFQTFIFSIFSSLVTEGAIIFFGRPGERGGGWGPGAGKKRLAGSQVLAGPHPGVGWSPPWKCLGTSAETQAQTKGNYWDKNTKRVTR